MCIRDRARAQAPAPSQHRASCPGQRSRRQPATLAASAAASISVVPGSAKWKGKQRCGRLGPRC
eukprot:8543873-Alexandrium_andersonii.AAC.1